MYKNLEIEINRIGTMKTEIVPETIGAPGHVRKCMDNFTKNVTDYINIKVVQKIDHTHLVMSLK